MRITEEDVNKLLDEQHDVSINETATVETRMHLLQMCRAVYRNRCQLCSIHGEGAEAVGNYERLIKNADALIDMLKKQDPTAKALTEEHNLLAQVNRLRERLFDLFEDRNRSPEDYVIGMINHAMEYLGLSCSEHTDFEGALIQSLSNDVCSYLEITDAIVDADCAKEN